MTSWAPPHGWGPCRGGPAPVQLNLPTSPAPTGSPGPVKSLPKPSSGLSPPSLLPPPPPRGAGVTQRMRPGLHRDTSVHQPQGGPSSSSLMQPWVTFLSQRTSPQICGWSQWAGWLPEVVLGGQGEAGAPRTLGTRKDATRPCLWETARGTQWPQSSLSPRSDAGRGLHPGPGLQLGSRGGQVV